MASSSRPKRRIVQRCLEYNGGLLHEEELAIRRALQASMVASTPGSDIYTKQKPRKKVNIDKKVCTSEQKGSTSTQTELKSSMKIRKKRRVFKGLDAVNQSTLEDGVSKLKKRKVRDSGSTTGSRCSSPSLTSNTDSSCSHDSKKKLSKFPKVDCIGIQTMKKYHKSKLKDGNKTRLDSKKIGTQKDTLLRKSFKVRRKRRQYADVSGTHSASESGSESTLSSYVSEKDAYSRNSSFVLAQRKFTNWRPTVSERHQVQPEDIDTSSISGKTEDFLTFLCLRGHPSMPKEFEVFDNPCTIGSNASDEDIPSVPSSPSPSELPSSPTSSSLQQTSADSQCVTPRVDSPMVDDLEESYPGMHATRMYAGITNISDAQEKAEANEISIPEPDSEDEPMKFPKCITPPLSFRVSPRPSPSWNGSHKKTTTSLTPLSGPCMTPSPIMIATPTPSPDSPEDSLPPPPPLICCPTRIPPLKPEEQQGCCSPPPLLYIPISAQRITHLHGPPMLERMSSTEDDSKTNGTLDDDEEFRESPPILTKHLRSGYTMAVSRDQEDRGIDAGFLPIMVPSIRAPSSLDFSGARNLTGVEDPPILHRAKQQQNDPIVDKYSILNNNILTAKRSSHREIPVIDLCNKPSPLVESSPEQAEKLVKPVSCPLHSQRGPCNSPPLPLLPTKSSITSGMCEHSSGNACSKNSSLTCPLHSKNRVMERNYQETRSASQDIPMIDLCDSRSLDTPKDDEVRVIQPLQDTQDNPATHVMLANNDDADSHSVSVVHHGHAKGPSPLNVTSPSRNSPMRKLRSGSRHDTVVLQQSSQPIVSSPGLPERETDKAMSSILHDYRTSNLPLSGLPVQTTAMLGDLKNSSEVLPPPWSHLQVSHPASSLNTVLRPYTLSINTTPSTQIGITSSSGYPSNYHQSQTTMLSRQGIELATVDIDRVTPGRGTHCMPSPKITGSVSPRVCQTYQVPKGFNGGLPLDEAKSPNSLGEGVFNVKYGTQNGANDPVSIGSQSKGKLKAAAVEGKKERAKTQEGKRKGRPPRSTKKSESETTPKKKLIKIERNDCSSSVHGGKNTQEKARPRVQKNPTSTKNKAKVISTEDDKPISTLSVSPILRPTEEEFNDPMKYLKSVQPSLQKFGICIVEPPESWKPECHLPEKLRFISKCQLVHRLKERWGPAEIKLACIEKHLKQQQNSSLSQIPQIGGIEVDLPEISRVMAEFGGMQKVIDSKKWTKVADTLRIPKAAQDRVGKLQDVYCKYLLSYDLLPEAEKQALEDQVNEDILSGLHSENQGKETEKDTECMKKGRYHSAVTFQRVARNMQEHYFKFQPSAAEVEREYWRIIQSRDRYVSVDQANVNTGEHGSCFPVGKGNLYAKSGWNPNVLPLLKGSLLRHTGGIEGLSVPWLTIDMIFSTDRWNIHPLHMYTLNYLHTAADKVWYGVPEGDVAKFPGSLQHGRTNAADDRDIMVSPSNLLRETGLTVTRLVQKQGQFVVVAPKAYHCSISCGYSVSESVAFAFPDWLLRLPSLPKDVLDEWPSFPDDKMVIALAEEASNESQKVLECIHGELMLIREKEASWRKELRDFGVTDGEIPKPVTKGTKGKSNGLQIDGCDLYCVECDRLCSLSALICKEEPEALCLKDAVEFFRKGNSSAGRSMISCYTLSQIDDITTSVKDELRKDTN